jgi:hypothetical protein
MLLIYSPGENRRKTWTFDLVFGQLLGIPFRITGSLDEFRGFEGPRLNYSPVPFDNIPFILSSGILEEEGIHDQSEKLKPETTGGFPAIFRNDPPSGYHSLNNDNQAVRLMDFDVFSAIFYFVSRYEEYQPFEPDNHGRFPSYQSLAGRMGTLDRPIVNIWAQQLGISLQKAYPGILTPDYPSYRFIPTIDVDNAWAYAHKGFWRTVGGFWRDRKNMEARNYRFQVLRDNQPDPYDTYSLLHHFHLEAGLRPVWFFLVGRYGKHDKNIDPANSHFRNLIREISRDNDTGLHPSYASFGLIDRLLQEKQALQSITGKPVIRARNHYLKIRIPYTYRWLLQAGITEDYTMGFADQPGFRAGIASPFRFFDLEENTTTDLTVYPFTVMDTGLKHYLGLNPDQAVQRIGTLVEEVRKVNGTFISLWHNESLSEWNDWSGWSGVYRRLLDLAKEN